MSRNLLSSAVVSIVVLFSMVALSGCGNGAKRVSAPSINAAKSAKAALEEYDANQDGKIAGEELNKCPALQCLDKGQGVTAEMIESQIKQWQDSRLGRTEYQVAVQRKGKAIAGATVKFVPEKFLGGAMPSASGTTDASGCVSMKVPDLTPAGVALGFYRVEITKDGESIPAMYNTETVLGQAINSGVAGIGATYNLNY